MPTAIIVSKICRFNRAMGQELPGRVSRVLEWWGNGITESHPNTPTLHYSIPAFPR